MNKTTGYQVYYDNGELYEHSNHRGDTIYTNREDAVKEIIGMGFTEKVRRKEYINGTSQETDVYIFPKGKYQTFNDYSMVLEVDILLPEDIEELREQ